MDNLKKVWRNYYRPLRLSVSLTIIATIFWAISLSLAELNLGFYGLIHSYSYTYYIGLGLLTLSSFILWTAKKNYSKLLFLQICLFITILWLTPVIIGGNSISKDWTYSIYFPNTDYINQNGHFNSNLAFNRNENWIMQNWAGGFIVETFLIQITRYVTADFFAEYGALVMQFIFLIPLYLFFNYTISNPNHRWAACWLFFFANWTAQIYYCPQALGLFLLLTIISLVVIDKTCERTKYLIIALMLIGALVITHLLTAITCALILVTYSITGKIKIWYISGITFIFVIGWVIYGASLLFESSLPIYLERAFDIEKIFSLSALNSQIKPSDSLLAVAYIRYFYTASFTVIALFGFAISFKYKEKMDLIVLLLLVPCIIMFFSMIYGSEYWMRTFLFLLIPFVYYAIKLLKSNVTSVVLIILLILLLPLNTIAYNGYAVREYRPHSDIAYWYFAKNYTPKSLIFGGIRLYYPDYLFEHYFPESYLLEDKGYLENYRGQKSIYLHIGETDRARYLFFLNDNTSLDNIENILNYSQDYYPIYTNKSVNFYFRVNN